MSSSDLLPDDVILSVNHIAMSGRTVDEVANRIMPKYVNGLLAMVDRVHRPYHAVKADHYPCITDAAI